MLGAGLSRRGFRSRPVLTRLAGVCQCEEDPDADGVGKRRMRGGWNVLFKGMGLCSGKDEADSQAVQLDVVDQESIDEAVHTVSELTDGRLDLLINNVSGHLILLTRADLHGALVQ